MAIRMRERDDGRKPLRAATRFGCKASARVVFTDPATFRNMHPSRVDLRHRRRHLSDQPNPWSYLYLPCAPQMHGAVEKGETLTITARIAVGQSQWVGRQSLR